MAHRRRILGRNHRDITPTAFTPVVRPMSFFQGLEISPNIRIGTTTTRTSINPGTPYRPVLAMEPTKLFDCVKVRASGIHGSMGPAVSTAKTRTHLRQTTRMYLLCLPYLTFSIAQGRSISFRRTRTIYGMVRASQEAIFLATPLAVFWTLAGTRTQCRL